MLPNFRICCRELGGLKVTSFCACVRSLCSVELTTNFSMYQVEQKRLHVFEGLLFEEYLINW